jgi:hypothetical protein
VEKEHREPWSQHLEESDSEEFKDNSDVKKKLVDFSVWRIPGFTIPVISLIVVNFGHFSAPIHLVSMPDIHLNASVLGN